MKWISVKDRLPDNKGYYLCFNYKWHPEVVYFPASNGIFYDIGASTDSPTHWMPLPEPPKEK